MLSQFVLLFLVILLVSIPTATSFSNLHGIRTFANRCNLVMRERKCDITGARQNSKAMSVSKSNVHTHRVQHVNLQNRKLWWAEGNKFVDVRLATKTLKTLKIKTLHQLANEYGVNLNKFATSSGGAAVERVRALAAASAAALSSSPSSSSSSSS
jgi:large subunit ribosomal protein L28